MRKRLLKKVCCMTIIISLITAFFPVIGLADETNQVVSVKVCNGEYILTYPAVKTDGDFYFSIDSYERITGYEGTLTDDKIGFVRGRKQIILDKKTGKLSIPVMNYEGTIGEIITVDGTDYISASKILPWLNVECELTDDLLYIIPDEISFWETIEDLDYQDYLFNLYEEFGDSAGSILGLSAMMTFDTILNLRWDRLVSADGTDSGIFTNQSLYDYKCYVSALSDFALDDSLASETAEKYLSTVVKVNNGVKNLQDILEIDGVETEAYLIEYLQANGVDTLEIADVIADIALWNDISATIDTYDKASKYLNVCKLMKAYEMSAKTDSEYREYIQWLSTQSTGNSLLDSALVETAAKMDESTGVLVAYLCDWAGEIVNSFASDFSEGAVTDLTSDVLSETFVSSMKTYLSLAKVFYSTVIPVANGYEGMSKVADNSAIQEYCWQLANSLMGEEMTEENLTHIRQSYITALKASKVSYEAMQDIMDVNIVRLIDGRDAEGLMDYKLDPINEKLVELTVCSGSSLNDSVDGKDEYEIRLKEYFSDVTYINNAEKVSDIDHLVADINNHIESYDEYKESEYNKVYIDADGIIRKIIWEYPDSERIEYYYDINGDSESLAYTYLYNSDKSIEFCFYSFEEHLLRFMDSRENIIYEFSSEDEESLNDVLLEIYNLYYNGYVRIAINGEADLDNSLTTLFQLFSDGFAEADQIKKAYKEQKVVEDFDVEAVREVVVNHYNTLLQPNGTYVSFPEDDSDDGQNYVMILRYQMSDEEADERMREGLMVYANEYVAEVYVNKESGKVIDELEIDEWFFK